MYVTHWISLTLVTGGLALTASTLNEARLDRVALRQAKINGLRFRLVRQDIRHEAIRLCQHVLLVAVLLLPTLLPVIFYALPSMWTVVRDLLLLSVSALLTLNSLLDLQGRRQAMSELRERRAPKA